MTLATQALHSVSGLYHTVYVGFSYVGFSSLFLEDYFLPLSLKYYCCVSLYAELLWR